MFHIGINKSSTIYSVNGTSLPLLRSHRDLGLLVSDDLSIGVAIPIMIISLQKPTNILDSLDVYSIVVILLEQKNFF